MGVDRRLYMGNAFGVSTATPFLGTQNLDESSVIFWTPASIGGELAAKFGSVLQRTGYTAIQARMAALTSWVERGHTLILIGAGSVAFNFQNDTNVIQQGQLEVLAPLAGVSFTTATGTRVDYCGPPALSETFAAVLPRCRYDSLIAGAELVPLLRVAAATAGTAQVVGGYRRLGEGLIFFIPPLSGNTNELRIIFDALAGLPRLLKEVPSELPEWVNTYQTASERSTAEKIAHLNHEVAGLQAQILEETTSLEGHRDLKQLLGGTGTAFANAVATGLRELDLDVVEGPHPRADLLSGVPSRFIAVEAKGIEGAVRETQFRQVERWTAEVNSTVGLLPEEVKKDPDLSRYATQLAKLNIPFANILDGCKGLLVVGTYRSTALMDRSEPDFPEPVLRLLNRSQVCALTGSQLFTLVMLARQNPALKAEIVTELMSTNGVLARGKNWTDCLNYVG